MVNREMIDNVLRLVEGWFFEQVKEGSRPGEDQVADKLKMFCAAIDVDYSDHIFHELITRINIKPSEDEEFVEVLNKATKVSEDWGWSNHFADWLYFERYRKTLLNQRFPSVAIQQINDYSLKIADKLLSPKVFPDKTWSIKGLVIGNVQSGKTANFCGVINRAIDAGYTFIVVLSGIHNDLRAQTQVRIDESVRGLDHSDPINLGRYKIKKPFTQIRSWTDENVDMKLNTRTAEPYAPEKSIENTSHIIISVVKKNVSSLRNLIKNLIGKDAYNSINERSHEERAVYKIGNNHALLVIDDESDQASIDISKDDQSDPSSINRHIRHLLSCFERSAYIGYTATPYANIFIDHTEHDNIFPEDFIITLPPTTAYVGPKTIFGCRYNASDDDDVQGLPSLIHHIQDHCDDPSDMKCRTGWLPPIHRSSHVVDSISKDHSLYLAMIDFVIAGAGLEMRKLNQHHSMLIHCSRFQNVMDSLHRVVEKVWLDIEQTIRYWEDQDGILNILRNRLESSFIESFDEVSQLPVELTGSKLLTWDQLVKQDENGKNAFQRSVSNVQIRCIHGNKDDLVYPKDSKIKVIAIGGNKLSRGLTLEGLSVSYFLRTSRMYDSLMQMGRWFGYRHGYLDLCRLYIPTEMASWFEFMVDANEELRELLVRMNRLNQTPKEYGLLVRNHEAMNITSGIKMRKVERRQVGYSETRTESVVFDVSAGKQNLAVFVNLLSNLGSEYTLNPCFQHIFKSGLKGIFYKNVSSEKIIEFLSSYKSPNDYPRTNSSILAEYIQTQNKRGPFLTNWSVMIRTKTAISDLNDFVRSDFTKYASIRGLNNRNRTEKITEITPGMKSFSIRVLNGGSLEETIDISSGDFDKALERRRQYACTPKEQEQVSKGKPGYFIRSFRKPSNGLIIIYPFKVSDDTNDIYVGFQISFPKIKGEEKVDYVVNTVYLEEEFADQEDIENG